MAPIRRSLRVMTVILLLILSAFVIPSSVRVVYAQPRITVNPSGCSMIGGIWNGSNLSCTIETAFVLPSAEVIDIPYNATLVATNVFNSSGVVTVEGALTIQSSAIYYNYGRIDNSHLVNNRCIFENLGQGFLNNMYSGVFNNSYRISIAGVSSASNAGIFKNYGIINISRRAGDFYNGVDTAESMIMAE